MEPGMTILLYIDLVLVGLLTVALVIVFAHRPLQEKKQREEEVGKVQAKVKEIKPRRDFAVASPQPGGARA